MAPAEHHDVVQQLATNVTRSGAQREHLHRPRERADVVVSKPNHVLTGAMNGR